MSASMIKKYCVGLLLLALWGCAPAHEYQAAHQEGAVRSSVFPRFSDRPEAEKEQMTQTDSQNLARELAREGQNLHQAAPPQISTGRNEAAMRAKILHEEVEQTLRQIEQGTNSQTQP